MSRILTTFGIAAVALGVVVAIVRGQESDSSGSRERSVLKRSGAASSRRGTVYSAPLAERLKAIREEQPEVAGGTDQPDVQVAPVQAPTESRYSEGVGDVAPRKLDRTGSSALLPVTEPGAAGNYAPIVSPDTLEKPSDGSSSRRVHRAPASISENEQAQPMPRAPSTFSPPPETAPTPSATSRSVEPPSTFSPSHQTTPRGSINLSGVSPTLRVEVIGPDSIDVGREGLYEVTVINQSTADAQDVEVNLRLPKFVDAVGSEGATGSLFRTTDRTGTNQEQSGWTWKIRRLSMGERERLQLKLIPRVKQPFQLVADWTARPGTASTTIDVRQAELRVVVEGPTNVLYGESAPYVVRLSNPGTGDAQDVDVNISTGIGPAQSRPIGTIAAGESREIRFELTAREAGTMQITAGATASGGLDTQVVHRIHIRRAKVNLSLSGPKYKFAGTTSTYKVTLSNSGDAAAKNVQAVMQLPAGGKYLSGIEGAKLNGSQLSWNVSDIEEGGQRTFQFQVVHGLAGENVLQALVQAAGDLRSVERFVTRIEALADLKLVVHDPKGPRAVNEEAIYEIHVINQGTKAAEGVRVIGQFSEGIEPVRVEGGRAEIVPGQVLFNLQDQIAPGDTLVLKVVARADQEGNHKFRAVVESTDPETKLIAEEMTRFFKAAVLQGR